MTNWFAALPAGWTTTRLKNVIASTQTGIWGDEPHGDSDDVRCVRVADFDRPAHAVGHVTTTRSVHEKDRVPRLLRRGDLLLEKSGGTDINPVGFSVIFDYDYEAVTSNFITRLRVRPDHWPQFWLYALAASYSTKRTERSVRRTTGIQNLDLSSFLNELFPVPPFDEQRAIADFLDRETTRIDTLIEEQQRLIELLQERRAALTEHAVSGCDLTSSTVQTSNKWWPQVPSSWMVVQLRRVITFIADGPHFSPRYVDEGLPFISARNIKVDRWALEDAKYVSQEDFDEFSKRVVPEKGDVLYTKGGTTGIARVVDLRFPFQVWVHVAVLKVDRSVINPNYLAYALNSRPCYEQAQMYTRGATNNDLGLTRMVNIELPLPPLDQQEGIVAYLHEQTSKIDTSILETERFIELSRERRAALITAAVTGQIDVREKVS